MADSKLVNLAASPGVLATDLFYTVPTAGLPDYAATALQVKTYTLTGLAIADVSGLTAALAGKQPLDTFLTDISNLTDPNADRIIFWDDSGGIITWLSLGTNISITGNTLNVTSGSGDVVGPVSSNNNEIVLFDLATGKLIKAATGTGVVLATSGVYSTTAQLSLSMGGTAANLADPNVDAIMFWDDSGSAVTWLTLGTNLSITGTVLNATGGAGGGDVSGPGAPTVVNELAIWNNTLGTLVGRSTGSGVMKLASGVYSVVAQLDLASGGTGANLVDPNADRIYFWDDSAGSTAFLSLGTAISITGTSLNVTAASTTVVGVSEFATAAEYWIGTDATRSLVVSEIILSATEVTLTDDVTIAVNFSTFINGVVTLGGNRTLGNPTNEKPGFSGVIRIVQDGTGNRTLAYGSDWEFANGTAPILSTAIGAQDLLFYYVIAANRIYGSLSKAIA